MSRRPRAGRLGRPPPCGPAPGASSSAWSVCCMARAGTKAAGSGRVTGAAGPCGVLCSSDQGVRAGEKRVNFFSETTLCPSEEPSPLECISANLSVGRAPGDIRSCGTNTAWGWVLQRKCRATDFVATNLTVAVQKFNSNCCHRPNPSPRTSARRGKAPTTRLPPDGRHLHRSIALDIFRTMIHSIASRSQDRH